MSLEDPLAGGSAKGRMAEMQGEKVFRLFEYRSSHTLEEQLAVLADMTQGFASSLNIEETLETAIRRFMDYMDAAAASIFLLEDDGAALVCYKCAGPVNITGLRIDASQGIVGKTVRLNEAQMVRDVSLDPDFADAVDADTGFVTRSILCAPLTVRGRCIGGLELINKRGGDGLFNEEDQHLVSALASAAALAIHNARMAAELVEQERVRKELELAREIQVNLLPMGVGDDFPVAGMNVPAYEVSGDFYDFFKLSDGRIYFNLADVSGKGMNAALLMAKTSSLLRCLAKSGLDAGELLARVNNEVCETASHGMFVTIVSGFIDPRNGVVELANAGHQPPLFHHGDDRFTEIPAGAPPIGIVPATVFPVTTLNLDGGSLYLFTDGVTESTGADEQPLDVAGLKTLIRASSDLASCDRLRVIVDAIRSRSARQRDDITLMIIEFG